MTKGITNFVAKCTPKRKSKGVWGKTVQAINQHLSSNQSAKVPSKVTKPTSRFTKSKKLAGKKGSRHPRQQCDVIKVPTIPGSNRLGFFCHHNWK